MNYEIYLYIYIYNIVWFDILSVLYVSFFCFIEKLGRFPEGPLRLPQKSGHIHMNKYRSSVLYRAYLSCH